MNGSRLKTCNCASNWRVTPPPRHSSQLSRPRRRMFSCPSMQSTTPLGAPIYHCVFVMSVPPAASDPNSRHYAYVISLLNTEQSVSAKLAGSGAFGPMTWPGKDPGRAVLAEIPVHIEAAPGDTVLSSGFSTIYPPDIPLGRVIESKISQGSSQELSVALFEDFRSLHNVYIVRNNRGEEIQELYEKAR